MRLALIPLLALAVVATACAAGGGSSDTPSPTESPIDPTPSPSDSPSPSPSFAPSSVQPSLASEPIDGERITGVLGADSVEGGCGYLQTADGTRYEVLYPDGWRLTLSPLELISPDGDVVARAGDEVTVVGGEATGMGSICQIGPIFQATSVEA